MQALARRGFEEVWHQRSNAAIDNLMTDDAVGHLETRPADRAEFKEMHRQRCGAFGNLSVKIEQRVVAESEAAVRWHLSAIHDGEGLNISPTKQTIDYRGAIWLTMVDGKITGGVDTWNMGRLLTQLAG